MGRGRRCWGRALPRCQSWSAAPTPGRDGSKAGSRQILPSVQRTSNRTWPIATSMPPWRARKSEGPVLWRNDPPVAEPSVRNNSASAFAFCLFPDGHECTRPTVSARSKLRHGTVKRRWRSTCGVATMATSHGRIARNGRRRVRTVAHADAAASRYNGRNNGPSAMYWYTCARSWSAQAHVRFAAQAGAMRVGDARGVQRVAGMQDHVAQRDRPARPPRPAMEHQRRARRRRQRARAPSGIPTAPSSSPATVLGEVHNAPAASSRRRGRPAAALSVAGIGSGNLGGP